MDSFDIVSIGKATLDIFLWVHEANKHFRVDSKTHELCIKTGEKAPVDKAYFMVGGNASNVAVSLSRMGFKSAIIAEIGTDEFAQKIINTLKEEGVSEIYLKQTTHQPSSFSIILNFKGDRTIFEENTEREHDFSFENINTKWVYLTSLENKWRQVYKNTLEFIRTNNVKLAFNPGTLQLDSEEDYTEEVIKNSEIVFLNKEEAAKICNLKVTNEENFIKDLLLSIKNKGAKVAVITDGTNGSFLIDDQNNIFSHRAIDSKVVERTGAGDAYASGFISAVLAGKNYQTAMKWGSENAASVIGKVGATAGLLRIEEMEKKENE